MDWKLSRWVAPAVFVALATCLTPPPTLSATDSPKYGASGFYAGEQGLDPSQRAGREIWYKATAGNDRFHTYVFQQRIGVLIDWYRVLSSKSREDRFTAWGLINDPDCCQPGSQGCPAKNYQETYGFDWCPGDETLLQFVGKSGYLDPACDFQEGPVAAGNPHNLAEQRQSSCDLAFGTSTGALGLRKFPNPKFDKARWSELNGGDLGSWAGYNQLLSNDPDNSDSRISHLRDGSIEPPFRIGMACGACHIAFDPLNPPDDPTHPKWENIKGAVGNQYARVSELMASGMPANSLEWQVFSHARPGATDTSAVPTDQVNNPGTQNSLINIAHRPVQPGEKVDRWRKTTSCPANSDAEQCWCEPGKSAKCWEKSEQTEAVHHILKGGGDSVGIDLAIQRVYINIGSCSESCWVNHLTDLRQLDPQQRGFGQTPVDIGQCRRDCPNFRAIEDRVDQVISFFMSPELYATDLQMARQNEVRKQDPAGSYSRDDLIDDLEQQFGAGAVNRGRAVFAENCASCHSSQAGPMESRDFYKTSSKTGLREDFLGNDQSIPVSEVGTFRCRALHSNHMAGHVWAEFSSTSYKERAPERNIREQADGGRGYYRNISLVSLWAHAPFLHNNALGPEICGQPKDSRNDFYRQTYVDENGTLLSKAPACWPYDPSVEGRFKLYTASMEDLLNPSRRVPKITKVSEDIIIEVGPRLWDGEQERQIVGLSIRVPAGTSAGLLGNFQYKAFLVDLVLAELDRDKLRKRLTESMSSSEVDQLIGELREVVDEIKDDPAAFIGVIGQHPEILELYSSCTDDIENKGHDFGGDLPDSDKRALIAFLATL
ncbi:MAG: cytochrome c [Gammaproteobacteria bacterium]|nr:cytochrome c [Gammaproteobacteria bacterium]